MSRLCQRCGMAPAETTHVCPPVEVMYAAKPELPTWHEHETDRLAKLLHAAAEEGSYLLEHWHEIDDAEKRSRVQNMLGLAYGADTR